MSPLACSLLALATLLVAADALLPSHCITKEYEKPNAYPVNLRRYVFHEGGGTIRVRVNACKKFGRDFVPSIQKVSACNKKDNGLPPHSIERSDAFTFKVYCAPDACRQGGTVLIVANCYELN